MAFFTKFILKYGPGSPGQTAKVFCKRFKGITASDYSRNWQDYLLQLARIRHEACLSNPLGYRDEQTYLNAVSEERWNELIDQTRGSLTAFIFIMMYFETKVFRNAVAGYNGLSMEQQKENRRMILETIYEVVNKTPYNNSLSLKDTLEIMDTIGGYYYFDISTSLSKTA